MTRSRMLAFVFCFALGLSATAAAAAADPPAITTLNVFAAASLREAFTAIGKQFEAENGVVICFNFAGADMLASQIVQPIEYAALAVYPIAVTKDSADPSLAAPFVAYVLSPAGQAILRERGFSAPPTSIDSVAPTPVR